MLLYNWMEASDSRISFSNEVVDIFLEKHDSENNQDYLPTKIFRSIIPVDKVINNPQCCSSGLFRSPN